MELTRLTELTFSTTQVASLFGVARSTFSKRVERDRGHKSQMGCWGKHLWTWKEILELEEYFAMYPVDHRKRPKSVKRKSRHEIKKLT
jgi:hypothetical protein